MKLINQLDDALDYLDKKTFLRSKRLTFLNQLPVSQTEILRKYLFYDWRWLHCI